MQRDGNLLHKQWTTLLTPFTWVTGYRQTGAVYTRRSGLLDIHPDRTPIRSRIRIGSNSNDLSSHVVNFTKSKKKIKRQHVPPIH